MCIFYDFIVGLIFHGIRKYEPIQNGYTNKTLFIDLSKMIHQHVNSEKCQKPYNVILKWFLVREINFSWTP